MKTIDTEFLIHNKNLLAHKKCVFIVGAGISVASGIPDFRSPTGIFASLREQLKISGKQLFTYNFGVKEGSRHVYLNYISTLKRLCDGAEPNTTHHFLANFPRSRVYTQNIDGLEERAGITFCKKETAKGVYLHGNLGNLACQYCGFKREFKNEDMTDFEAGKEITCSECVERSRKSVDNGQRRRPIGIMHPGIIHYQQVHPDGAFIGRMCERDMDCDLLIVIGTSLAVDGVKKLVKAFCKNGVSEGKRVLVNLTKPNKEWGDYFDYFFEGDCADFVRVTESMIKKPREVAKAMPVIEKPKVGLDIQPDSNVINPVVIIKNGVDIENPADSDTESITKEIETTDTVEDGKTENSVSVIANISQITEKEQATSFCADLQEEIENIVSESVREEVNTTKATKVVKKRKKRTVRM